MSNLFYVVEYGAHQIPEGKVTFTSSFALIKFLQSLPLGMPHKIEQHLKMNTPNLVYWETKTIRDRRIV